MAKLKIFPNAFESEFQEYSFENSFDIKTELDKLPDNDVYQTTMVECYDPETKETFYAPLLEEDENESILITANNKVVDLTYKVKNEDEISIYYLPMSSQTGYTFAGIGWGALGGAVAGALAGLVAGALISGIGAVPGLIAGAIIGGVLSATVGGFIGYNYWEWTHQNTDPYEYGEQGKSLPDVRGAENQSLVGNAFPCVIGKHLITPFIIGTPYTTYEGENGKDAIIREILVAGYAPLKLTDFKLDETWLAYNRTAGNTVRKTVLNGILTGDSKQTFIRIKLEKDVDTLGDLFNAVAPNENIKYHTLLTIPVVGTIDNTDFSEITIGSLLPYINTFQINDISFYGIPSTKLKYDINIVKFTDLNGDADSGDILDYWKNNDIAIEILQQSPEKEVNYGTIYPNKVVDTNVNANLLYVIDGDIEEVAKKKEITYKNNGFINGLRTNRVQFTESCPQEFTVNLSMPKGLYANYSKKGTQIYEQIPLWLALQWRFYSDENNSSDESGFDYDKWHNFLTEGSDEYATYYSNTKAVYEKYSPEKYVDDLNKHKGNIFDITETHQVADWEDTNFKWDKVVASKKLEPYKKRTDWVWDSGQGWLNIYQWAFKVNGNEICTDCAWKVNADWTYKWEIEYGTVSKGTSTYSGVVIKRGNNFSRLYIIDTELTKTYSEDIKKELVQTNVQGYNLPYNFSRVDGSFSFKDGETGSVSTFYSCYTNVQFKSYEIKEEGTYVAQSFFNKNLLNFEPYSGEDGISEIRSSFTCKLKLDSCKEIISNSHNRIKGIEVRAIRVSPCYIDMTNSWGSDNENSPIQYSDSIVWKSLVTKPFNEDVLTDLLNKQENSETDNNNEVTDSYILEKIPEKILSEADLRKLCVIAIQAKADANGIIQQQMKSISCIAESFSPYFDTHKNEWFPTDVHKVYGYYKPVQKSDGTPNGWEEVTKEEYEEARGNGLSWKKENKGSNFSSDMLKLVLNTTDQLGRNVLNDEHEVYNENNAASGFMLAAVGIQNGEASLGYEDLNILSLSDAYIFNEGVVDGSTYSKDTVDEDGEHLQGDAVVTKYTANAYLYQQQKLEDLLRKLAICSRGIVTYDNFGKLQLLQDKKEDYPKGVINQQNCISGTNTYSWAELPAGLQFNFNDENDGFEKNQIYCWADNNSLSNYKGQVQQYTIDYVTNPRQMWSLGRYVLACMLLQREILQRKIGPDGELYSLGDTILVQDESLLLGDGSAKVQDILEDEEFIYGFITDTPFTYRAEIKDNKCTQGVTILQPAQFGKSRTVTLRLGLDNSEYERTVNSYEYINGEAIAVPETETVVMKKGITNVCLFDEKVRKDNSSDPGEGINIKYKIKTGDIVMFGDYVTISQKYKISKIKPEQDGTFTETLVPYYDEIYSYGASLPSFQSNVRQVASQKDPFTLTETPTTISSQSKILENVTQAAVSQAVEQSTVSTATPIDLAFVSAVAEKDYIQLSTDISNESTINSIQKVTWTITRKDGTTKTVITNSNNGYYYFDRSVDGYPSRADLADWTVSAKYTNIYGNECANATSASVTVSNSYLTWTPTACTATVTPNQNGLEIKINHNTSGFYGTPSYTIVVNGKTFTTYEKNFTYAFVRTGTGADGYPEASDFTDNNYTVQIYANNEAYTGTNGTLTTVLGSSFVTTNYGTWIPPALASSRFTAVLGKNGITISDNVEELSETQYYGQPYTLVYEYSLDGTTNWQTINDKNLVFSPNPHQESAYYNAAKVRVTRKSTANKSSSVTMKAVDRSSYGTWATPSVVRVSAKADIDGIELTLDTRLNSATEYYAAPFTTHIMVSKDAGATWEAVNGTRYNFVRTGNNQEFPEASNLANWQFKAYYTSNIDDGQESSKGAETLCTSIDTSTYGSWTVSAPNISSRVSGRNVTLSFTQPSRADGRVLYGNVRYKVSIKKTSDTQYYAPATAVDPYASEDNYKDITSTFVDNGDLFQQVLPLEGQNLTEPLPVDTSYIYSVVAYNSTSNGNDSTATTVTVIALATSAKDIVAAAITTNKLADDCVTFEKIHANVVTGEKGTFKDLASENLVLGKVSGNAIAANANNFWDLEKGEFKVGDANQYLHVVKDSITQEYQIEFKVGNFEVSATASALSGNTYIYDNNDKTKRAVITYKGFKIEKYNGTTQTWESVGLMEMDSYGNLILTNSSEFTTENKFSSAMPDDENDVVYHFDKDYYDNNGTNSKSLEFNNVSLINTEVSPLSNIVLSGEVTIPTTSDDFNFWSKSEISDFENLISLNSNTFSERVDLAGRFNKNASTDWGLTSTQINNNIAVNKGA